MIGVVIMAALLAFGLFIFVPFMIRRALRQAKEAREFVPELLRKSGLRQDGGTLKGEYRGFPVEAHFGLGFNYGKLILSGESGWRLLNKMEGRNTYYQTLHVQMKAPGAQIPTIMFKEHTGILRTDQWFMDLVDRRNVELPAIDGLKVGAARVYGTDANFCRQAAADAELRRLIEDWHFTDLRAAGDTVELVLNNNMVMPTFGSRRMARPDFVIEALDMCARLAELGR
ncbi:MAG: hypothetical protein RIF32_17085 [Leptospirales bacterium]|jgi:hypothetical protein